MSREPETCTVELSTGTFVHLAQPPSAVLDAQLVYHGRLADREADPGLVPFPPLAPFRRITHQSTTDWRYVLLDVTHIVAVYPIRGRPEPAMIYSVLAAGGVVPPGT